MMHRRLLALAGLRRRLAGVYGTAAGTPAPEHAQASWGTARAS